MKSRMLNRVLRDYFTLNKTERQGFVILCILMMLALVLNYLAENIDFEGEAQFPEFSSLPDPENSEREIVADLILFPFDPNSITPEELDLLNLPGNVRTNILRYREKGGVFRKQEDVKRLYGMSDSLFLILEPFLVFNSRERKVQPLVREATVREFYPFDPNTLPDSAFHELPLPSWLVRNILSYRAKGGKFRQKEDLKVIYGMDDAIYSMLDPWLLIEQAAANIPAREVIPVLDINQADSLNWVGLPGIGPVFASRILKYRGQLGGFHSVEQLGEVFGMTPERISGIRPYLRVAPDNVKQLRINYAGYEELRSHPYIAPAQAREIIRIRSEAGPYISLDQLLTDGPFDGDHFQRVRPYLTCF